MTLYKTRATDGESDMALTFFNNKYIPSMLREGQVYLFRGQGDGHPAPAGDALPRVSARGQGAPHPAGIRPRRGSPPRQIGAAVQHALSLLPERIHDPCRTSCGRSITCAPCATPWRPSTFPKIKRKSLPPGSGWPLRSSSSCSWDCCALKSGRKQENLHPIPGEFPRALPGCCPSS